MFLAALYHRNVVEFLDNGTVFAESPDAVREVIWRRALDLVVHCRHAAPPGLGAGTALRRLLAAKRPAAGLEPFAADGSMSLYRVADRVVP